MMKTLTLLLTLFSLNAKAIGILSFDAKVESFDEKTVTVVMKDNRKIRVPKTSLNETQQKSLKEGATVQLSMNEKDITTSIVKTKK